MISERDIVRLIRRRRRSLGYTQRYVVIKMQLAGFDISEQIYRNIEINRRLLKVPEFLFLVDFLGIDIPRAHARVT